MPDPTDDGPKLPSRRGRRLKNLHLDRVDLVHAPANPPAKVKLFKEDAEVDKGMNAHDVAKRIVNEGGKFVVYSRDGSKKLGTYATKAEAVARLRQVEGFKKCDTIGGMMSLDKSKLSEPVRKHLEELETSDPAAAEALTEALAATQVETPAATSVVDDVAKSELAKLQKSFEDERAARLESEKRIAKMEADAKLASFVALAKADFEPLGKAEDVADVLLAVSEAVPADKYQALERLLKGAAAQLATGEIFKQRTNVGGEPTDAETRIEELAKEAFKAGVAKTIELAKLHVIQSNPELLGEYNAARNER